MLKAALIFAFPGVSTVTVVPEIDNTAVPDRLMTDQLIVSLVSGFWIPPKTSFVPDVPKDMVSPACFVEIDVWERDIFFSNTITI